MLEEREANGCQSVSEKKGRKEKGVSEATVQDPPQTQQRNGSRQIGPRGPTVWGPHCLEPEETQTQA